MSMKKSSKNAKKKKNLTRRQINNRRGIVLVALLAVTILIVNLVAYSYSWFTPIKTTGIGLALDTTGTIRSEHCTFETYQGTLVTTDNWETGGANSYRSQGYFIDQVAYSDTEIADNAVISIPKATVVNGVTVPGRVYFRTNVQNEDTEHSSCISLYHHQFPDTLGIGVTYPSNTYFINDMGDYDDCWILRNAYVKKKDVADVDGPGLLQVEWFVENFSTTSTNSIRVTTQTSGVATPIEWLYLMYN